MMMDRLSWALAVGLAGLTSTGCAVATEEEDRGVTDQAATLAPITPKPLPPTAAGTVRAGSLSCIDRSAGGVTCGANAKDNCCLALPVSTGVLLDKYQVTSGRMRSFVEAVGGNVRGWYAANKTNVHAQARAQVEPYLPNLPSDLGSYPWGVYYQLGVLSYVPDQPSHEQGCFVGNSRNQGFGSHTYALPPSGDEDRAFSQADLDQRSLNCVPYPMLAAFCAWDGGWVPTWEDEKAARPTTRYPWGNTPEAGGYNTIKGTTTYALVGPATADGFAPKACPRAAIRS